MKKFLIIFIGAIIGLFVIGASPNSSQISPTVASQEIQAVYPDFTLQLPQIGLITPMERIVKQGATLPVPDEVPGYYSIHDYNLFIVGHNNKIFKRLDESPTEAIVWNVGKPSSYKMVKQETKPISEISMEDLLEYHGIVIMTCAGDYLDGKYTHRLILYYND